jgi:hypothetical protein
VDNVLPQGPQSDSDSRTFHQVIMLDELATEKCVRWDNSNDKFQGTCQEHNHRIPLTFTSERELDLLCDALQDGQVHMASEVHHRCSNSISQPDGNTCISWSQLGDSGCYRCAVRKSTGILCVPYPDFWYLQKGDRHATCESHQNNTDCHRKLKTTWWHLILYGLYCLRWGIEAWSSPGSSHHEYYSKGGLSNL